MFIPNKLANSANVNKSPYPAYLLGSGTNQISNTLPVTGKKKSLLSIKGISLCGGKNQWKGVLSSLHENQSNQLV
jgi:hypothetical protein